MRYVMLELGMDDCHHENRTVGSDLGIGEALCDTACERGLNKSNQMMILLCFERVQV